MFKKILALCSTAAAFVLTTIPAHAWFPFGFGFGGFPFFRPFGFGFGGFPFGFGFGGFPFGFGFGSFSSSFAFSSMFSSMFNFGF